MPTLLAAAHEDVNMTVVIMDNSGVAMTGGQNSFITGEQFTPLLRGLGVDPNHIIFMDPVPKNRVENLRLLLREVAHKGLSVIVASRPCIHLKRRAVVESATASKSEAAGKTAAASTAVA